MKLVAALLCPDCEEIHESMRRCPSCGSEARPFAIARVIKPMPRESVLPVPTEHEARPVVTTAA